MYYKELVDGLKGDNRNDLHNLSNPIKISLEWYNPQTNKDIYNLFTYAVLGLQKLGVSYDIDNVSSLIGNTISHYINLIERALERSNNTDSIITNNETNVYKDIWTEEEISIINKLFDIAKNKKNANDNYSHYIKSIQSILNDKDDKIREIIYMKTTKIQKV